MSGPQADLPHPAVPTAATLGVAAVGEDNRRDLPRQTRGMKSRVERWRGGLGNAYLLTGPFVCRCLTSAAIPRFHLPLIEPDVQISRIRLSDKVSHLRPREVARSSLKPDQPESAQVGFRVA